MLRDHSAVLTEMLVGSQRQLLVELDRSGAIVDLSVGFTQLLGRHDPPLGCRFDELFEYGSADPPLAPPPVGTLVAYTRPPSPRVRLHGQVVESKTSILVVAERIALEQGVIEQLTKLNDEMTNLLRELHKEKAEVQRSLERIKRLEGLISICSYCHRIRNEQKDWQRLEEYLHEHSDALFSHGICPGCFETHFGSDMEE